MRQKLITLCLNSFELATKKPNFSAWVRMKLLDEGVEMKEMEIYTPVFEYKCPLCKKKEQYTTRIARNCSSCASLNPPLIYPMTYVTGRNYE